MNSKRMAVNGMAKWLCKEEELSGFVGQLCGERRNINETWPAAKPSRYLLKCIYSVVDSHG